MARHITRTMRVFLRAFRPRRKLARALPSLLRRLLAAAPHEAPADTPRNSPPRAKRYSLKGVHHRVERARGKFIDSSHRNKFGARRYKLFVPAGEQESSLPLVVMLPAAASRRTNSRLPRV